MTQLLPDLSEPESRTPIEATSSLELLRAVYSDPAQPISRRLRAAIAALPFEHPKLAVVASMHANEGFAAKLEEAIARSRRVIDNPNTWQYGCANPVIATDREP